MKDVLKGAVDKLQSIELQDCYIYTHIYICIYIYIDECVYMYIYIHVYVSRSLVSLKVSWFPVPQ